MEKKHLEVVAAVIMQKFLVEGSYKYKIFCAQRPGPKPGKKPNETSYKWEFPGGKIEQGESREVALKREIYEEFGAKIEVINFIMTVDYEYEDFSITMHAFYCTLVEGSLELKEHIESAWVEPALMSELNWAAADIPIMRNVQQDWLLKSQNNQLKATKDSNDVALRVFTESDMEQFISWLNVPHVAKWFTHTSAWIDEVSKRNAEYGWIAHYIINSQNKDVGFCQFYPFALSGETNNGSIPIEGTYSIDYFVGDSDMLRHGITRSAISKMCTLIKCFSSARRIIVQPNAENIASQKTLVSAGFHYDEQNDLYILEWN